MAGSSKNALHPQNTRESQEITDLSGEAGYLSATERSNPYLTALKAVFDPAGSQEQKALAHIIRTLANYCKYRPISTSNQDLEVLLAVSIVMAEDKERGKR